MAGHRTRPAYILQSFEIPELGSNSLSVAERRILFCRRSYTTAVQRRHSERVRSDPFAQTCIGCACHQVQRQLHGGLR